MSDITGTASLDGSGEGAGRRPVHRALVSVYDKQGLPELARGLHDAGVALVSTGSTAARIAELGVPVTLVEDLTGFPECLDGRVKTLHPKVHAGILADRRNADHERQLADLGIEPFDLVVSNLYPFRETVRSGAGLDDVVEQIDIGGPSMVRAAAKNHASVAIVTDPSDYPLVVEALQDGGFDLAARRAVALPNAVREIEGMSGQRYRDLINALIESLAEPRYLEVGSWAGSTAAAALHANRVTAVCIDNWSQFGGPREQFFDNTRMVLTDDHDFRFIEADFRRVDYHAIGTFNVFLFDGPHTERDQYDGVVLADPALAEDFILIVDDWNWRAVRIGTMRAIADRNWTVEAAIEIRTTMDESHPLIQGKTSDWHNGYFLAAIRKHR